MRKVYLSPLRLNCPIKERSPLALRSRKTMTSTAIPSPTPTQKEVKKKNQEVAKKSSNLAFVLLWEINAHLGLY